MLRPLFCIDTTSILLKSKVDRALEKGISKGSSEEEMGMAVTLTGEGGLGSGAELPSDSSSPPTTLVSLPV